MVAIVNAAGNHVPPVYVCPRKRANPLFMNGAVPGAIGLFSDSGWINAELHLEALKHKKKYEMLNGRTHPPSSGQPCFTLFARGYCYAVVPATHLSSPTAVRCERIWTI